jgi:hypothetical protein
MVRRGCCCWGYLVARTALLQLSISVSVVFLVSGAGRRVTATSAREAACYAEELVGRELSCE